MSPRLVLSSYHCTIRGKSEETASCDHSGGERSVVLGEHEFDVDDLEKYQTIPIIKVLAPPKGHKQWKSRDKRYHDFAMLVLKYPVKLTSQIGPVCLPEPNAEFGGKKAVAAGWGRTHGPTVSKEQSPVLIKVELTVSYKRYRHYKMFGTRVSKRDNIYQDPCSGDSGSRNSSSIFVITHTWDGLHFWITYTWDVCSTLSHHFLLVFLSSTIENEFV